MSPSQKTKKTKAAEKHRRSPDQTKTRAAEKHRRTPDQTKTRPKRRRSTAALQTRPRPDQNRDVRGKDGTVQLFSKNGGEPLRRVMRSFKSLNEREVLALAISLEEEDARIYADLADGLKDSHPNRAEEYRRLGAGEDGNRNRLP